MSTGPLQNERDRRDFVRSPTELPGRYMLPDQQEFACKAIDVSVGGMSLQCPRSGEIGDRVIAYIAELGRVEGTITRLRDDGFAMEFTVTAFKREKIRRTLEWLDKQNEPDAPVQRRHTRIVPERTTSEFELPDGRSYPCEVIDMSIGGASVRVCVMPSVGTPVKLGRMEGVVARHHDEGLAIQFTNVPDLGTIADHFGSGSAEMITRSRAE